MPKTVMIPLQELKLGFFVRKGLNEDRMLYFAELYEAKAEVDPLEIDAETYEIIDGRHRKAALEFADFVDAPCILVTSENRFAMMSRGFEANLGGSLPPTKDDTRFFLQGMLREGHTRKDLVALMQKHFPASVARRYVNDAALAIKKKRMRGAINAVANKAMTVPKAAREFDVPEEDLRAEIGGKKKKKRANTIADLKSKMSKQARSNSTKTAWIFRNAMDMVEDGELTYKQSAELVKHANMLVRKASRTIADWEKRLEAMNNGGTAKK